MDNSKNKQLNKGASGRPMKTLGKNQKSHTQGVSPAKGSGAPLRGKELVAGTSGKVFSPKPVGRIAPHVIKRAIEIDAPTVSSKPDRFVEANFPTYVILISLWVEIVVSCVAAEFVDRVCAFFTEALARLGLLAVIDDASRAANAYLRQLNGEDEVEKPVYDGVWKDLRVCIESSVQQGVHRSALPELTADKEVVSRLLLCLRYPKRFSPRFTDKVEAQGLRAFADFERRNRLIQRSEFSHYIFPRIREIVHEMLLGYSFRAREGYFSTGSQVVGSTSTACEGLKALHMLGTQFADFLLPTQYRVFPVPDGEVACGSNVSIKAVPKAYDKPRIIGMEDAGRAWVAQAVNYSLREAVQSSPYAEYFHFTSQEENSWICSVSSTAGDLATIDQTSASDSITWSLVVDMFPACVIRDLRRVRPFYKVVDGKFSSLQMALSSGHACTATLETIVFLAIDIAVAEYVGTVLGKDQSYWGPSRVVVYNDDQIVPVECVDLLQSVHQALGLIPNLQKSFWVGPFREACGQEAYNGFSISHAYFPRKTLSWDGTPDAYLSLISHQEKLPTQSTRLVLSAFLEDYVRFCKRKPTHSSSLDHIQDLYGLVYLPQNYVGKRPGMVELCDLTIQAHDTKDTQLLAQLRCCGEGDFLPCSTLERILDRLSCNGKPISARLVSMKARPFGCSATIEVFSWYERRTGKLLFSPDPSFDGELHLTARATRRDRSLDTYASMQLDLYRYATFLERGPRYEDPLMELLGVTSPYPSSGELCTKPVIDWCYDVSR